MKRGLFVLLIAVVLMVGIAPTRSVFAQPDGAVTVQLEGAEGLMLHGNYYAPTGETPAPAILLLHQNNSSSREWDSTATALLEAGYAVLAIDQRGFGLTKGTRDWALAEQDVVQAMEWLRLQDGVAPERVAVMGGSIGSTMALRGCAADQLCKVVIALSPGLEYLGVSLTDVTDPLETKAVLLIAGHGDRESANSTRTLASNWLDGDLMVRMVPGSQHGVSLIKFDAKIMPVILEWLRLYN